MKRQGLGASPQFRTPSNWREFPPPDLSPILKVALQEIVTHGYDATSVRVIAEGVGVTVPALYYHFANKQALLVALLDHAMDIVMEHLTLASRDAGNDPVLRFAHLVEAISLYMANHRDLAFLDSERRSLTQENLSRYAGRRDDVERLLRDSILDGCRSGNFGTEDPDECGRAILSMCQGIAAWYRPNGPMTPGETASRYVKIALAVVERNHAPHRP